MRKLNVALALLLFMLAVVSCSGKYSSKALSKETKYLQEQVASNTRRLDAIEAQLGKTKEAVFEPQMQEKPTAEISMRIISKENTPMVLIPAGEFRVGSDDGESDEKPVHTVHLDAFYMDAYEVTNAQYQKFIEATGHRVPRNWDKHSFSASPDHPVVGVSWHDARAYAEWVGKRLPSEAEWEKAARGGLVGKKYPHGDNLTHDDSNYHGTGGKDIWEYTSPVGSFAPNGYGLYDMAGNVWEWCADWYDANYYINSPTRNPMGPDTGLARVLRGGGWNRYQDPDFLRVALRHYSLIPTLTPIYVGFRCAKDGKQ